ncbi:putative metabolite transport protein [Ceratocystis lukuohia]|uniref:Metabolite transport protein n=1 Tax=Ceratocystis lukuohia TaxID=2019550 RepID=A0ABR4M9P7_9PEZI
MATSPSRLGGASVYVIIIVFLAALGPLQFGFHIPSANLHQAELNAPQDVITCKSKPVAALASKVNRWFSRSSDSTADNSNVLLPDCIPMSEAAFATISSIFTIGGLTGALAAGPLTSKFGRRLAMRITGICFLLGAVFETFAGGVGMLVIGRFIGGLGAGASTVIVPLYVSEVAPPASRGLFGTSTQVMINVGILVTQVEGYFFSYGNAWRWILGSGVILGFVHIFGLSVVPESPAWLASQGRFDVARRNLQRIRGGPLADISDEVAAWKDHDAAADINAEQEGLLSPPMASPNSGSHTDAAHLGFLEVLQDPDAFRGIVACVGIATGQQLCGINSIIMYSVSLLNDMLPMSSALLSIIISLVNLGTTVACSPLPDKLGRRKCLLLSIAGQGTSSVLLAFSIQMGMKYLSAFAVLGFVGFFAVGLGPVPFIMASELVNQEAVGAAQSWALGSNYISTFLIAQFFPIANSFLNDLLGGAGWIYYVFGGLSVLVFLFVLSYVPETKGKRNADEVWGRTRRLD